MFVRVFGIDAQPVLNRVPAAFAVGAFAQPVGRFEAVEQIGRGHPRIAKELEGRLVRAVIVQPPRELFLVVSVDLRPVSARSRRRRIADVVSLSAR